MTHRRKGKIKEHPDQPLCGQCGRHPRRRGDTHCESCAEHRDRGIEKARKYPGR